MNKLLALVFFIFAFFFIKIFFLKTQEEIPQTHGDYFEESYMLFGINITPQNEVKGFIAGIPRPCVRIQGHAIDSKQPYNGIIFHVTGSDRLISLQDIAIVPC